MNITKLRCKFIIIIIRLKVTLEKPLNIKSYLRDVLILAFSAFGGPQAHIAMLFEVFVSKKKYLQEEELIELQALCSILPGPTSTQTITAIGYKLGGISLASFTLICWITPAFIGMLIIGLTVNYLAEINIDLSFTKYVQLVAIGMISYAAYMISKKVIKKPYQWIILFLSIFITTYIVYTHKGLAIVPFIFPLLLILGGIYSGFKEKSQTVTNEPLTIKWKFGITFLIILIGLTGVSSFSTHLHLLDIFYRNGTFVYGGGQVLIPLLQTEFVETEQLMTNDQFLTGFGLVNAMPGPVFSLSAYLGVVSLEGSSIINQLLGGFIGVIGIFLPGTLLIFFVYPFWESAKKYPIIKNSLIGINAVACGLIISASLLLLFSIVPSYQDNSKHLISFGIILATIILLHKKWISAPIIIGLALAFGVIL